MRILVACEESQRVTMAFREKGHEVYSCDVIECSGGHPEWHIQQDVLPLLNGDCKFTTIDGVQHKIIGKWDMIIAHPPCTYLTVSGNRWFNVERYGEKAIQRLKNRELAISFFMTFTKANCEKIAIENPIGIMSSRYRKPNQIIHPWQFGHPEQKTTCLWLKNLPNLIETNNVKEYMMTLPEKEKSRIWYLGGGHSKERSKTFLGIAKAMADQWG